MSHAEDAAHTDGDHGLMALVVRNDTLAALAGADGDYSPIQVDANGAVYVLDSNSAAIAALLTTIDSDTSKITACNTGAVVISSGAVTATLSATDNAVLDAIDSNTDYGAVVGEGAITAATLRVTQATDDDGVAHLATIAGDTTSLDGKVTACNTGAVVLTTGSAAIGKLAANTGVDIGDVDVTSISAGINTIGGVIGQHSSSTAYDGTTAATIKRSAVLAATGTVTIAAAPTTTKKIRVLALAVFATSATATSVYLKTSTDDILGDASNPISLAIDADGDNIPGFVLPWNPGGWFETVTADEALSIVLSAAQDVIVSLTWIEVA